MRTIGRSGTTCDSGAHNGTDESRITPGSATALGLVLFHFLGTGTKSNFITIILILVPVLEQELVLEQKSFFYLGIGIRTGTKNIF